MRSLQFMSLEGFPSVKPGDDLAEIIAATAEANSVPLQDGDVLVIAQKVVSKSEGRYLDLDSLMPSPEAERLAGVCKKDPRLVQAILDESTAVVRCRAGVLIVRTRSGLLLANAGIDQSNLPLPPGSSTVLLLPRDADASAHAIKRALEARVDAKIGVAIIDSLGRAWRIGTCGTCIGAAGIETVQDLRGRTDLFGRLLQSSIVGAGDELAAGASLVMGQGPEGTPVVVVRGLSGGAATAATARDLVRPISEDLFP